MRLGLALQRRAARACAHYHDSAAGLDATEHHVRGDEAPVGRHDGAALLERAQALAARHAQRFDAIQHQITRPLCFSEDIRQCRLQGLQRHGRDEALAVHPDGPSCIKWIQVRPAQTWQQLRHAYIRKYVARQ